MSSSVWLHAESGSCWPDCHSLPERSTATAAGTTTAAVSWLVNQPGNEDKTALRSVSHSTMCCDFDVWPSLGGLVCSTLTGCGHLKHAKCATSINSTFIFRCSRCRCWSNHIERKTVCMMKDLGFIKKKERMEFWAIFDNISKNFSKVHLQTNYCLTQTMSLCVKQTQTCSVLHPGAFLCRDSMIPLTLRSLPLIARSDNLWYTGACPECAPPLVQPRAEIRSSCWICC